METLFIIIIIATAGVACVIAKKRVQVFLYYTLFVLSVILSIITYNSEKWTLFLFSIILVSITFVGFLFNLVDEAEK